MSIFAGMVPDSDVVLSELVVIVPLAKLYRILETSGPASA